VAGRPLRGAPVAPAGGGLPDARVAHRGRRRRPGHLAAAQPGRDGRGREPRRVADHDRGPRLPEHAAVARHPARGAPRRPPPRSRDQRRGGAAAGGGGVAGRLGRAGPAGRARHPVTGGAARVRAPRHVRAALRGDRPDGRPDPGGGQAAGQQGPAPGQGGGDPGARPRPGSSAGRGRRLLPGGPRGRLRRPRRPARPRGRAAGRLRGPAARGLHGHPWPGRRGQAGPGGRVPGCPAAPGAGGPSPCWDSPSPRAGSSRSTRSPIPSASGRSPPPCSATADGLSAGSRTRGA
jgi:hypothetical protein